MIHANTALRICAQQNYAAQHVELLACSFGRHALLPLTKSIVLGWPRGAEARDGGLFGMAERSVGREFEERSAAEHVGILLALCFTL